MIGHYIEDDELDAFSLVGLLNGEGNLAITTSTSLKDFDAWVSPQDVDFVLLDINRPDARSLAKDVKTIRQSSKAPIVFITGDEAIHYREQAVAAGAQAVIEKNGLSASLLKSVLQNVAVDRPPIDASSKHEHLLIHTGAEPFDAAIEAGKVASVFAYMRTVVDAIVSSDASAEEMKSTLTLVSGAFPSFSAYYAQGGDSAPGQARTRALPTIIRSIQEAALAAAAQRKIKLVFQMGTGAIDGIAEINKVQLGIRHFLHAAIVGSPAGATISFSASPTAGGMRINASSSTPFRFDGEDVFTKQMPAKPEHFNATISMTLATMLLDLQKADLTAFSRGSLHTIMADYVE